MHLKKIPYDLTVCKVNDIHVIDLTKNFYFIGKTDEEISFLCNTKDTPLQTIAREDGWKGFRLEGILEFSLIGILSKISNILADNQISIFALSTYNTDYVLVKATDFDLAMQCLEEAGYTIE